MKETLYILSSDFELIKHNNTLVYKRPDPQVPGNYLKKTIPILRLRAIEVYGNIKVSTPLLKLCNELNLPCYFNTFHGAPIGQFIPARLDSKLNKLRQFEAYLDTDKRISVAKAIVRKSSEERTRLLKDKDNSRSIKKTISKMGQYQKKISKCTKISELRGIEGNIMKTFFEAYSKTLKSLPFNGRSQQPPKDEGNAVMSYGNVILYNTVGAELFRSGLDPVIGFLHEPQGSRNSLALDIAEMFRRTILDKLILTLDHKKILQLHHFKKDNVQCLLNKKGKKIWIEQYRKLLHSSLEYKPLKRKISVQEEFKLECYNLLKFFTSDKKEYKPLNFHNN